MFEIRILGSNSATPAFNRNPTSQLLNINHHYYLIDCGEGTQMQMIKYKIKTNKIKAIFISHLHGDHYLGLVGLLSTMHLFKRVKDLYLFGPKGLKEIIALHFKYSDLKLNYKIHFNEISPIEEKIIHSDDTIDVTSFPLQHRIDCTGFIFKEKPKKRRLNKERLTEKLPTPFIKKLKNGEDIKDLEGNILYSAEKYTLEPHRSFSYAYCSDTIYDENIIKYLKNVDVLYHESTFLNEHEDRARDTYHSTALQAATIAKKSNVKHLILGHYSSRYKKITPFLEEASKVFKPCSLAIDGEVFNVEVE